MSQTALPRPLVTARHHRRRLRWFVALLTASALVVLALLAGAAPASAAGPTGFVTGWGRDEELLDIPASLGRTGAVAIAAGGSQGLAITPAGTVVEWRTRFSNSPIPWSLTGKTVTAVAASGEHSVALTSDGKVVVWGYNSRYLDDYYQVQPPAAMTAKTAVAIAAGGLRSMALTSDGQVWSWGESYQGEDQVPTSLTGKTVTAIAAGDQHDLALTSDGRITAWGYDARGQTDVPSSLDGTRVTAIAAGANHNLALTADGRVVAWGDGAQGQTAVPSSLAGTTVTAISAGGAHSLALTADGRVVEWGDADGWSEPPAALEGQKVTAIAAGEGVDLALTPGRAPIVASSPAPVTVEVGETASFSATVTGLPTASVQWQRADDGGAFEDVPGATRTTYALVATRSDDGARFRAVFTNAYGSATSAAAPLRLNRPPTAPSVKLTTGYESPLAVRLPGSDPDGDPLTYLVSSEPTHGTLTGTAPTLTYTPSAGYEGPDSFTYRVRDRTLSSSTGTVAITVSPRPNAAPVATGYRTTVLFESATAVNLVGTDADGDPLTYDVVTRPGHGALIGTAPTLTYVPDDGYSGPDSFTYRVNDGRVDSATATVSLTVAPGSCVSSKPRRDLTVHVDERDRNGTVRMPRFSTTTPGELLVAHVAAGGGSTRRPQTVTRMSGGGLTWSRVVRESTANGTSEVWQAYAAAPARSVRVRADLAAPGRSTTILVVGFDRAQPTVGASVHLSGRRSAPTVSLTPQASGSVVWAVGRVDGSRYRPAPLPRQKVVHATSSRSPRAGAWVQRATRATEEGTPVVVGDRKRAARWGYAAVEIRGTCR